jgi:DNA-binding SARP family transcriptional activator
LEQENAVLEVMLFKTAMLRIEGQEVVAPTRKALGLIAYLALEGPVNRDRAAELLWGEMSLARARRNLRQELYRLSGSPLGAYLETDHDSLRLQEPFVTDVTRFRAAVKERDFPLALELYTGALLSQPRVPGAEAYSLWLERERASLAALRLDALAGHAAALTSRGEYRAALEAYLECLVEDGLQEQHHREVMRLHARLGERAEALAQFDVLRRKLRREVGLEPLPETVALAAQIRAGETAESSARTQVETVTLRPPLVGRRTAWDWLQMRSAQVTLLTGEPGIGKSRLAQDFAASHGAYLLLRGYEISSGTPLLPIAEAIRAGAVDLNPLEPVWKWEAARLVPELEELRFAPEASGTESRARFVEGLTRAVLILAEQAQTILLDDLHWFDASSLEVIAQVLRRGAATRRVIVTARSGELTENPAAVRFLEALGRETKLETIALERLSSGDAMRLAEAIAGERLPENFQVRLHEATAGNPLYILETLRGWLEASSQCELQRSLPLQKSVQSAVVARVDHLGAAARRVLEAASLSSDPIRLSVVARASALGEWETLEIMERAARAHLLDNSSGDHRFSHDLVRRALDGSLSAERKRLLHGKIAETLIVTDGSPAEIASHLESAGSAIPAIPFRVRAAEAATALFAYREALTHYELALQNGAKDHEAFKLRWERTRLYEKMDQLSLWESEVDAMDRLAEEIADPNLEADAVLSRATLAAARGDAELAMRLYEPLIARTDLSATRCVRAHIGVANALMRLGQHDRMEKVLEAALKLEERGERSQLGQLHYGLAVCAFNRADLEQATRHNTLALRVHRQRRYQAGEVNSLCLQGFIYRRSGDHAAVLKRWLLALERARLYGLGSQQRTMLLNVGNAHLALGEFAKAEPFLREGLDLTRACGDLRLEGLLLSALVEIAAWKGELGAAIELVQKAIELSERCKDAESATTGWLKLSELLLGCGACGRLESGRRNF